MFTGITVQQEEYRGIDPASRGGWEAVFGTSRSTSGASVTVRSSFSLSPWWSGISLISGDISKIPLRVLRRVGKGKEPDTVHAGWKLLRRKPNAMMTANFWRRLMTAQAIVHGNSYSLIIRTGGARPVELLPLDPNATRPDHNSSRGLIITQIDGIDRVVEPENIFHIKSMSMDGRMGMSLIDHARNSLGKGLAQEEYAARFFSNNAVPEHVMIHPERLSDAAVNRLRQSLKSMFSGPSNSHQVGVFEEGIKWQNLGVDAEKAQLIESLKESVKDVARWLNIPSHRLGDDSKTSFASLEQENLSYQDSTLGVWFDAFEEEAYDKILTEQEKDRETHTIEFLRNKILLADASTRTTVYASGIQNGWLSRDEVRAFENLNPIPEGEGEAFLVQANLVSPGADGPDANVEPEQPAVEEGPRSLSEPWRMMLADCTQRAVRRLAEVTRRTAENNPDRFLQLIESLEEKNSVGVAGYFAGVLDALRHDGWTGADKEEVAKRLISYWRGALNTIADEADYETLSGRVMKLSEGMRTIGTEKFVTEIIGELKWSGDTSHEAA